VNSISTGYYDETVKRQRSWRRFFKPAAADGQLLPQSDRADGQQQHAAAHAHLDSKAKAPPVVSARRKNVFSGLRMRLVGTVFLAIVPPLGVMYVFKLGEWTGFLVGLLALAAAWYGGERFIMRQLRALLSAAEKLAQGDLTSRTGVKDRKSELGQLARTFDTMAESLQQRAHESEQSEKLLLNRAQQQAVVAAIGQFAMVSQDFNSLLNQALQLAAETLEVQLAHVLELQPETEALVARAGIGWRTSRGRLGSNIIEARGRSQGAFVLRSGAPVIIPDMRQENRFIAPNLLLDHSVVSGICLVIATRQMPYGMLGIYTTTPRVFTGDEVQFLLAVANSIGMAAERRRTEAELQKLAAFAQLNPNPAMELADDGTITYFNDTALRLALSVEQNHPRGLLPQDITGLLKTCLASNQCHTQHQTKIAGRTLSWSFHPVPDSRVVHCYVEDSTERLSLESQLRQAQKMESIGQLAAGVAHDFNNMLTIIQGHAGMLMARPGLPPQALDSAQAVFFASERAASLTRQLLMFSRKNVMQPKHLDLRDVVANMSKMLHRLLGETVTLDFTPPAELPLVEGDTGMMEQVIMNLCVNARDAMERGGSLTIELSSISIAEDYAQSHPDARSGPHVSLRVSDTGCGMDTYVITRIFEPFFTTKEVGKGTGLGLATVYGIVKQHSGWVEVTSQPGAGTTFNVFFPASAHTTKTATEDTNPNTPIAGGNETVLVVEDEPVLREMAQMLLEECGYRVILATNGKEALEIWERHQNSIDLLFTDMVMPAGLSGMELAHKLIAQRKELRVVFASGYTVDDISTDFLMRNNDARFLQKPYTRNHLARAVREALDGDARHRTSSPLMTKIRA
jgi:signal transduction histidine kinase/ActR/RegA family two-component response regulator/HAMP domain-containing protein